MDIDTAFREHYKPLCIFAMHYTGSIDTAEDIVQECFVRLCREVMSGKRVEKVKPYLYTMVRNLSIDAIKASPHEEIDSYDIAEEEFEERSHYESNLWGAIDALPSGCREIFLMSKRDGMKNKEIADELGISIKTVENQMTKALSKLKSTAIKIYNFIFA